MKPFDVVIQRGTNHAWVNKGDETAVLVAMMVEAEAVALRPDAPDRVRSAHPEKPTNAFLAFGQKPISKASTVYRGILAGFERRGVGINCPPTPVRANSPITYSRGAECERQPYSIRIPPFSWASRWSREHA